MAAAPLLREAARQLPGEHAIERLLALALCGSSSFEEAEPLLRRLVTPLRWTLTSGTCSRRR